MTFSDIVNLCVRQLQGDKVEAYMKHAEKDEIKEDPSRKTSIGTQLEKDSDLAQCKTLISP